MQISSLVFDLFCLVIILLSAIFFARKGVIAGLLSLLGSAIAIGVAVFGANRLAPVVFGRFFEDRLVQTLGDAFAQQNALTLDLMLEQLTGLLPPAAQQALLDRLGGADLSVVGLAETVVGEIVKPVVLPIITLVLFIIFFLLLRVLIGVLLHLLQATRGLPYLGTAQKAFGGVAGVCIGAVYVLVMVVVLKGLGGLLGAGFPAEEWLASSLFYQSFGRISLFSLTLPGGLLGWLPPAWQL